MPYCGDCGIQFGDHLKFCPHCGEPNAFLSEKIDNNTAESKLFPQQTSSEFVTQIRNDKHFYGVVNLENLPKDHVIDERYEIKEKLGQGGFGAVYLVYDMVMEIEKALKIIPEAVSSDKEAMFDLQQEARTMITLNHPNIVRVYDFHNSGNIKFIDMEYVDGKTLSEIKLEYPDKCVPEERVKELAIKIAEGMVYAHDNNVLHKDIKPQNIKVNSKGEIKIMDFGIAETVRTSMSRLQNSSSSGTLVYMSPEQIRGKNVGRESDIYSFGALIYELLSGHPPFYKGDISYQILNEKPEPLTPVSSQLNDLILKCLEKGYSNRFFSFNELKASIDHNKYSSHVNTISKSVNGFQASKKMEQVEKESTSSDHDKKTIFDKFMKNFSTICLAMIIILLLSSAFFFSLLPYKVSEILYKILLIAMIIVIIKRRKLLNGLDISIYWFSLSILLYFVCYTYLNRMSWEFYHIISSMNFLLSSIWGLYLLRKRKKNITGNEIAIYWFGLSIVITCFVAFPISAFTNISVYLFVILFIILSIISSIVILTKRKGTKTGLEIFIYWFGLSVDVSLLGILLEESFFSAYDIFLFIGPFISISSGMILITLKLYRVLKKRRLEQY
ncbi:MAG: protein kinase [Candidatus Stygibacter australis]|nr:protein kinase [Candidatus Stygibacter australis]